MEQANIIKNIEDIDMEQYILATYNLSSSTNLFDAAWNLARGQSCANPLMTSSWETDTLFNNHCAFIVNNDYITDPQIKTGKVRIAFPLTNLDITTDGISQLLCHLQGGQSDIDILTQCYLEDLSLPKYLLMLPNKTFRGPKYDLMEIRKLINVYNKPLLGGIIKPKVGLKPNQLLDMVKMMVDNGIDFIKEDEIASNPLICRLDKRVPLIANYLRDKKVVYCFCINSDSPHIYNRANFIASHGKNLGVHVNIWSGLGTYRSIRNHTNINFIHGQTSGHKAFTHYNNPYGISFNVICELLALSGCSFQHIGMIGGYLDDKSTINRIDICHKYNTIPILSCGMGPEIVNKITEEVGVDYLANVGGKLHSHPGGTLAGVKAMRQAIDGDYGKEYYEAIDKWGKKDI